LERLERDVGISVETIALFVRFWLTATPYLPELTQCVALFLRDRSPPQFRRLPGLKPYRRLVQDATGTTGVEFIAENGSLAGMQLKKARRVATKPKKGN
jgi:hypothetical protein